MSYNYLLSTVQEDNLPKLCILVRDLCLSTSKFKNYYFREVVASGFTAASFMKIYNLQTYYLIVSKPDFLLYKHTLYSVLDIGMRKFKGIIKNYGTIVKLEYSNKEISYNRLSIKNLKNKL